MPLLDHMESHIWNGSDASGDLWNGRWLSDLLSSLLSDSATLCIAQKSITKMLKWLQTLTDLLQTGQRALFAARRTELLALALNSDTRRFSRSANAGPPVGAKPSLQRGRFLILPLDLDVVLRRPWFLFLSRNALCLYWTQPMTNGCNMLRLAPTSRNDLPHIHLDYIIE